MKKLRVAVVGAGRLGGFHAQKLAQNEQVELVGVADPVAPQRDRVAANCRTRAVADCRELFGQVDAAVIATPTILHHSIALEFLNRGVPLLVEKPLCSTSEQADELVRVARRKGVVLQVGHVERFNPAYSAALPHISQPTPKYIETVRASSFTFRSTDIGVVLDLMIHDLDAVLSLVNSPVRRIDALGLSVFGGQEDVANARLEFESGCVAVLNASRASYETVRRMHAWTPRAFASIDFGTRKTTLVRPHETLLQRRFDVNAMTPEELQRKEQVLQHLLPREELQFEAVDALAFEVADFVESVLTPRAPRVTGEHGRDAVAVAEQILAKIAAHAWDDQIDGRVGPLAIPRPSAIPAPHFTLVADRQSHFRDAG